MLKFNHRIIILMLAIVPAFITADGFSLFKKKKETKQVSGLSGIAANKDSVQNLEAAYSKVLKDVKTKKGLFTTHITKTNKLYFELDSADLAGIYLLSNRIAETSNTRDFVAGQMVTRPFMITFSRNKQTLFMHKMQSENITDEGDPIEIAFKRNFTNPVLKAFKIIATKGSRVVVDVTPFFVSNEKCISPLKEESPLSKLLGGRPVLKGKYVAEASALKEVKTFPQNIEIKSLLSFTTDRDPYSVVVHRSVVKLPDVPMKRRLQDNRVGYFSMDRYLYTSNADKIVPLTFINRWRLEPRAEDMDKYLKGELVEPAKPIIFYVDNAFPPKWRETVKQGIEDWNIAFEAAGFKNAIQARDYPENDPDFDPDDMRYSCVKYAASPIANAMGPSYIDPRSGEILTADVIWYHNILSLLHRWRFTQTAAIDPRVRKNIFDDEVMQESMRYVASHEIGHTLGLMHNMGASYSFPVDSLRSPSFTKKYGTTPSIMDYARNNFIAQPGDKEKGVKLTPPVLGVYDIYAINWGYRLIPEANTPKEELPVLHKWIDEKKDDPMYQFGAQQFFGTIDPTAQTEDLGDDHIKGGDYAVSNLKIIMKNLEEWTMDRGADLEPVKEAYAEVVNQYSRHLRHVMPYIGGVRFYEIRQGDPGVSKSYYSKKDQKRAMEWLLSQARTYNSWLTPPATMQKLSLEPGMYDKYQIAVIGCLLHPANLSRIADGAKSNPEECYTIDSYLKDTFNNIFRETIAGRSLNETERNLQSSAISVMMNYTKLNPQSKSKSKATSVSAFDAFDEIISLGSEPVLPCSHYACEAHSMSESSDSFYRINMGVSSISSIISAPLMTAQLKNVLALYKRKRHSSDAVTKAFYDYQIILIENLFKN